MLVRNSLSRVGIAIALQMALVGGAAAQNVSLRVGVLAGLTGDPAPSGQAWNESAKLAADVVKAAVDRAKIPGFSFVLVDSQDSQGSPKSGVEAAQKLVQIDKVNVIVGDFYSSVTSAVATSVAIPNKVLMFTGGTSPALTKLNATGTTFLWQPVAADDIQGRVLAAIIADAYGPTARINIASRNDAYGTNLSAVFKEAWTAKGGVIPKHVTYNPQQPTLDSEAQDVTTGDPTAWLFVDFCPSFAKLAIPLSRTGKWDSAKSFGSDTLNDCESKGSKNYPGMRATQANASSGSSAPAFKALFEKNAKQGVRFAAFTAQAFDSVIIAFLATLEAKSSDPEKISQHVVNVTTDPGKNFTFEQLDDAIKAIRAGEKIHYQGVTGAINFGNDGRVNATAYDIWEVGADGVSKVVKTIAFKP